MSREKRAWIERGGQAVIAGAVHPLIARSHPVITGRDNLVSGVPTLYMPFHHDGFDPFYVGDIVRRETGGLWVITAKDELNIPVFGHLLRALGCEFVVRKKSDTDTEDGRREYIANRYVAQSRRTASMPDGRGMAMNFPEGTRHPDLTMIFGGAVALSGCIAREAGMEIPIITVGTANGQLGKLGRNMVRLHGAEGNDRSALHFGEPLWMGGDVMDRYIEGGPEAITDEIEAVTRSLAISTNTAHQSVGLPPLEYVGKVPPKRDRKKQK